MTQRFSFGNLDINLSAGSDSLDRTPSSNVPFRIAVLGDFSGQAGRENPRARPAKLRPIPIDRDDFEDVLERLGAEAHLQLGTSRQRLVLPFGSLEDFHPDRIFARLPVFERLRDARTRLNNPSTFAEAAAEVRRWSGEQHEKAPPAKAVQAQLGEEPADEGLSASFLLEALQERGAGEWNEMLRDLVKPYRVEGEDPAQTHLVKIVDAAIGELMGAILHHPEFQALEVAWRGVYFLVRQLETGSDLKVYLLDIAKEELAADLNSTDDLAGTALYKVMVEETVQTPGADPWTLLAGNYVFDLNSGDIEVLGRLGKIASAAGAPFVGAAGSSLIG